jgi:hypothetical protein
MARLSAKSFTSYPTLATYRCEDGWMILLNAIFSYHKTAG